jgi:hypothetical protein
MAALSCLLHRHFTLSTAAFRGSFCYIAVQTVFLLNWLTAQPSYEVKAAAEGDKKHC